MNRLLKFEELALFVLVFSCSKEVKIEKNNHTTFALFEQKRGSTI
jgi:hypothetical protein